MIETTSGAYLENGLSVFGSILRPRTCLYVGAHPHGGMSFLPELLYAGYRITIVEAHAPNLLGIESAYPGVFQTVCADIREFEPVIGYNTVFWWHGPEHLPKQDIMPAITKLESVMTNEMIIGCPWGEFPHGDEANEWEKHRSALYPEDLTDYGFAISTFGKADEIGSQLVGYMGAL